MNTRPSLRSIMNPDNARKILRYLMVDGTKWLILLGAIILLFADVWLGAQVFQSMGMDGFSSYMLACALSALQIALFQRGGTILRKARTLRELGWAYVVLIIGWLTVLADSFVDGSAAFVKVGSGLPKAWSGIADQVRNPYILILFSTFFVLSFLGERLGRLAIYGEHDEVESDSLFQHDDPMPRDEFVPATEVVSDAIAQLRRDHPLRR